MTDTYRPRRQSTRWLDADCPSGVLAIYDNGGVTRRNGSFDRFTVFYVPTEQDRQREGRDLHIFYRGMSEAPSSPQGFGVSDDMPWWQARAYRTRVSHHAATWSSLPAAVQEVVRRDCAEIASP